jgi:hypothetical protein
LPKAFPPQESLQLGGIQAHHRGKVPLPKPIKSHGGLAPELPNAPVHRPERAGPGV